MKEGGKIHKQKECDFMSTTPQFRDTITTRQHQDVGSVWKMTSFIPKTVIAFFYLQDVLHSRPLQVSHQRHTGNLSHQHTAGRVAGGGSPKRSGSQYEAKDSRAFVAILQYLQTAGKEQ